MPPIARKTVLIADDDAVAVTAMSAALQQAGIQVIAARDAMQAVMAAHRTRPDAILMDINMPGGTGFGALEKLRSSSKTQLIPVVVVTGSPDDALPLQARSLGAVDFIRKPVDPADLQKRMCALLDVAPPKPPA